MNQLKSLITGLLFILLQISVLNLISIRGIRPDLIVLFVVWRALIEGPTGGVVWGFGLGLLLDTFSGGPIGLGALAYSLTGFLSGQISSEKGISRLRYATSLALGAGICFFIFLYFREPWDQTGFVRSIILYTLPGILYTWCIGFVWVLSPFSRLRSEKGYD